MKLKIYLALSNMSIALFLGHHPEGAQKNKGRYLWSTSSVNTYMWEDNNQYDKVLSDSIYLSLNFSGHLMIGWY